MSRTRAAPTESVPRLWGIPALAKTTTLPASTIYTLVARGEIAAVRIGRSVRIDERDWLAYLAARRERAQ